MMFVLFFPPVATGWLGETFDDLDIDDQPTRRQKGKWACIAARAESVVRSNRCSRVAIRAGQRNRWRTEDNEHGGSAEPRLATRIAGKEAGRLAPARHPRKPGLTGWERFESAVVHWLRFWREQSYRNLPADSPATCWAGGVFGNISQGSAEHNVKTTDGDRDLDAGWFFDTTT